MHPAVTRTPLLRSLSANPAFAGHLGEILKFYEADGIIPRFYLTPMGFSPEVGEVMGAAGFCQTEFAQALLYGLPSAAPASPADGIAIQPVTHENLEEYVETSAKGFQWPIDWREETRSWSR